MRVHESPQKEGHRIVIATGRPYRSSRFVYERFGLDTPIINYNGGLITHPRDPSFPVVNFTVRKEVIIDIFDHNIEHIRNAFSEVRDTIYLYREEAAIEPLLHRTADSAVHIGPLRDILETGPQRLHHHREAGQRPGDRILREGTVRRIRARPRLEPLGRIRLDRRDLHARIEQGQGRSPTSPPGSVFRPSASWRSATATTTSRCSTTPASAWR
ncbi:MAG: HAD hydrolase family protein [Bacillus subtilis]|nr:HAD hydrolase family protein [Bacillus subtilis]